MQSASVAEPEINDAETSIKLFVNYVTSGGNTRRGEYFYSFAPDLIVVRKPRTRMDFSLCDDVPASFKIVDVVTSDSKFQLDKPVFAANGRSVSVINENTQRQLIYVVVLVHDAVRDELVACDPQVINSPEGTNLSNV